MAQLGNLAHTVRIDERDTGRAVWQSTSQSLHSVAWERQHSDTSVAKLQITASPWVVSQLEPWKHIVSIYANDELVWYGPLYQLKARRDGVELVAHDPSVWWPRRRVAQGRSYLNQDATMVMRDLVTDAMSVDDPCRTVTFMVTESAGVWVTKDTEPAIRTVQDEVGDLESAGLVWTFSAGRLLVGPVASGWAVNTLTDDHWNADVAVVKDGAETVTDMLIQGKGVYGYHIDSDQDVGLLQGLEKADSLVRAAECESLGRRRVEEAKFPTRRLELGGSARLLPSAPVTIQELVPGALVPVSSSQTGVVVSAIMAIKSVSVEEDGQGSSVQVTLMERPSATVPELVPDMVEEDYNSPYDRDRRDKEQQMPRNDSGIGRDEDPGLAPVV